MPCSTLEKISATATTDTAMTGPRAAMMRTADNRRRNPCRRITALTGSDQTLAPRPSHSAARKMLDWRRLPLDDLRRRKLLDEPPSARFRSLRHRPFGATPPVGATLPSGAALSVGAALPFRTHCACSAQR